MIAYLPLFIINDIRGDAGAGARHAKQRWRPGSTGQYAEPSGIWFLLVGNRRCDSSFHCQAYLRRMPARPGHRDDKARAMGGADR